MFISKKVLYFLCLMILLVLVSCSNSNPLITEELERATMKCKDSEELLEVTDEKSLKQILKEINNSRREGTEEMEFPPEGHYVTLEMVLGETRDMSLFDDGQSLMKGFYIHSDIPNFCGK